MRRIQPAVVAAILRAVKRTLLLGVLLAGLASASPASTHENGPVLIIRHVADGCHAWGLPEGPIKASQTLTVGRGIHVEIGNNDVMPHRLLQLAGPRVKLPLGARMNSLGAMIELNFPRPGVYRFTTAPGAHYAKHVKTVGKDHVLRLKVIVR